MIALCLPLKFVRTGLDSVRQRFNQMCFLGRSYTARFASGAIDPVRTRSYFSTKMPSLGAVRIGLKFYFFSRFKNQFIWGIPFFCFLAGELAARHRRLCGK